MPTALRHHAHAAVERALLVDQGVTATGLVLRVTELLRQALLHVELEGVVPAEVIDLHRVIDHQIDGGERLHPLEVETSTRQCRAHGGEVDEGGHTGEVLEQHPPHGERYFSRAGSVRLPPSQRFDVLVAGAVVAEIADPPPAISCVEARRLIAPTRSAGRRATAGCDA
jgi:hypothetical protein